MIELRLIDSMTDEVWKKIPIADGYEASSLGRIRSPSGRILRPWIAGIGYHYVSLGKSVKTSVHRLVALAFHGAHPDGKPEVAHLDGSKTNNAPENLAWVNHSENEQQKRAHGTYARPVVFFSTGQKKRGTKPSRHPRADEIVAMRGNGNTIAEIAACFGMSKSGMHGVIKNRI